MLKYGEAPYLECSSKGDKRFSPFFARIERRRAQTIESIYQGAKVFEDGSTGLDWRKAKGRRAVNAKEVAILYSVLWDEYIQENPHLYVVLLSQTGLSDMFGRAGHPCQVTELWRIRNEGLYTKGQCSKVSAVVEEADLGGSVLERDSYTGLEKRILDKIGKP